MAKAGEKGKEREREAVEELPLLDMVVRRRLPELKKDVARPIPMQEPRPMHKPPVSIHYEVFAKKVAQLVRDGVLAPSQADVNSRETEPKPG